MGGQGASVSGIPKASCDIRQTLGRSAGSFAMFAAIRRISSRANDLDNEDYFLGAGESSIIPAAACGPRGITELIP